jgi:hypothetical protein
VPALVGGKNLSQLHRSHVDIRIENLDETELFRGIAWKLGVRHGEISGPMPISEKQNEQVLRNILKYNNDEVTNFRQRE